MDGSYESSTGVRRAHTSVGIHIDEKSKQKLINSIITYGSTPINIICQTDAGLYSLLKIMALLPDVLTNIIYEYIHNIINVTYTFNIKDEIRNSFSLTVNDKDNLLFDGKLYIRSNPKRWYLVCTNSISLYFVRQIDTHESLCIFNEFMKYYYNEPKYIDDGEWLESSYPGYYFKDEYLMRTYMNSTNKLKNKELFKKMIIVVKVIINIIIKYYVIP